MKINKFNENFKSERWDEEKDEKPEKDFKFNYSYRVINTDTLEQLQLKALGYNHDHAYNVYFGKANKLPIGLKQYSNGQDYIFIFWEDKPKQTK